ncbi:hypothetical protein SAMN04488543_3016 [Friedmanniella luteola]|uniref:Prenyltransferase and squalene oxidase repeat-containing protein n=1 Tax=Friedmanniella luteola TaxID=546871 RepID=A0A1H1XK00_9ACTN|nr:hypothetical protein [Friedmanniella luteola]SDT09411.1 hypothetical protein SAMN04488543_3016 [Friedmanniella luteola]
MTDLDAARTFVHSHARLVDRRRFQHLVDGAPAELVLTALAAYRNPDGGIGGLDPDTRSPTSQPIPVRYALEVLALLPDSAPRRELALGTLDWLATVTGDDGGVPFLLTTAAGQPAAAWMQPSSESSLLATVQVAAAALRLRLEHPWLDGAQEFCWARVRGATPDRDAYAFKYAVDFLDATPDRGRAEEVLDAFRALVPADGRVVVGGGVEGEDLEPLTVAPWPDHAGARLYDTKTLDAALDALESGQAADGGWDFSWDHWNPAVVWETRGAVTLEALQTLRAYGRL